MTRTAVLGVLVGLLAVAQAQVPNVRVEDLTSRPDLVGQVVAVDGRLAGGFEYQRNRGWSRFRLQGSPVLFRLPPQLTYKAPPAERAARVQGVLRRQGSGYAVDVTVIELFASDLARLEAGLAGLAPDDARNRDAWARWAAQRAEQYDDPALRERARSLAGKAIQIEADRPAVVNDPQRQLELAQQARQRGVPEPVPSSLVHRALRRLLPGIREADEAERLAARARDLLPAEAQRPQAADIAALEAAYTADPASAYHKADPTVRAALDRRLLADALRKALELRAEEDPGQTLALADRAEAELPDQPEVARRLRERGLEQTDVAELRLAEVQERARAYETLGQPDRARDLLRSWLDDQRRNRLGATDAEGRLLLAEQYETLIDDRQTALALLREAWAIDPHSEALADAFRRRGYRLVEGAWVAFRAAGSSSPTTEDASAADSRPAPEVGRDPYIGRTRREVLDIMGGRPTRIARAATQGQIREQWIYELEQGGRRTLYINFVKRPGQPRALVVSSYRRGP